MRYGSVCSGIEAATMAWHPLGWEPAFFSEIEAYPCAVLAHHYPHVPNHGDMTKFEEWPDHAIDLLVGGTPCQSFSVAGLRQGLADPRGNLMLTYLAIARRYQPRWLVWENVPGVLSSNGGRDFGTFLTGLAELGYGFAYRVLDAQYIRVDGFPFAVPQRRRRVFVVGYLGDWRRAAAVLFERESLCGNPAPRREARKDVAPTISARTKGGGGLGTDFDCDGGLIVDDAARCVTAGYAQRLDWETENFVAHALRGEGFDASEDGTGRGTPLVPVPAEVAGTLKACAKSGGWSNSVDHAAAGMMVPYTIAFSSKDHGADASVGVSPTLRAMGHGESHPNAGGQVAIAFNSREDPEVTFDRSGPLGSSSPQAQAVAIQAGALRENPSSGPDGVGVQEGIAYTIEARAEVQAVQTEWAVRRLTPTECERLQGFPDNFTAVPHRGKPAADGPRYKALGNSMAVNVMRWIGYRIDRVESMLQSMEEAA